MNERVAMLERKTKETDITIELNLDGCGESSIETGIGFFDHMLTAFTVHSGIDLKLRTIGDLEVDSHHTIEDTGIALGQAFLEAIGGKIGIARYGTATIPMDESLAFCSLDFSGRAFLVFNNESSTERIGDFDCSMIEEFFRAFAFNSGITLHINVFYGKNDHHKCEAIFKSVAHAISDACAVKGNALLTTKGVL